MSENDVEVLGLGKTYPGGVEAVKPLAFEVGRGEVFGLLGPNGAGKSTTIGMLTTTIRPTVGTARLGGFDIGTDAIAARRVSSVVFQEAVVDRSLSGRRNLDLHARLWGVEPATARRRIDELVEHARAERPRRPPGRRLQRGRTTPARDRPGARLEPAGAVSRRADGGPRPSDPRRAARRTRGTP